jgi:hypothetical protein
MKSFLILMRPRPSLYLLTLLLLVLLFAAFGNCSESEDNSTAAAAMDFDEVYNSMTEMVKLLANDNGKNCTVKPHLNAAIARDFLIPYIEKHGFEEEFKVYIFKHKNHLDYLALSKSKGNIFCEPTKGHICKKGKCVICSHHLKDTSLLIQCKMIDSALRANGYPGFCKADGVRGTEPTQSAILVFIVFFFRLVVILM